MTTIKQSDIFARRGALAAKHELLKLRVGDLLEALTELRAAYRDPAFELGALKAAERRAEAAEEKVREAIK